MLFVSVIYGKLHVFFFFFFNDTATTEIYTLSLHDALPIYRSRRSSRPWSRHSSEPECESGQCESLLDRDRKSTRLNSSHSQISYAVFCLKKKKTYITNVIRSNYTTVLTEQSADHAYNTCAH